MLEDKLKEFGKKFDVIQEIDNKYDQTFRRAEIGEKYDMDDNSDEVVEEQKKMEEYFTKEPHDYGTHN